MLTSTIQSSVSEHINDGVWIITESIQYYNTDFIITQYIVIMLSVYVIIKWTASSDLYFLSKLVIVHSNVPRARFMLGGVVVIF